MNTHHKMDGTKFNYPQIIRYRIVSPTGVVMAGKPFGWLGHIRILNQGIHHEWALKRAGYKVERIER